MKLYYIPFACSQAIHIILNELNLPHQLIAVDPETKQTSQGDSYLTINPNGYVPALLLDDNQVITEVPAILQYLLELADGGELEQPENILERAKLQSLLNFLSSELHKAFVPYWYQPNLTDEERQNAYEKLARKMTFIESILSDGRAYLMGQNYSIADAYAFVLISWCGFHDIDISVWPFIAEFSAKISKRPAVIKTISLES